MEYKKTYDYGMKTLDSGFEERIKMKPEYQLADIINSAKENIIIFDSNDYIIDEFLVASQELLNNSKVLVIGLVNLQLLNSLKTKGINGGFFRSTDTKASAAIIIVDKKDYYVCFDNNEIYKTDDSSNTIYNYINHLIWAKTTFEFCQGRVSKVDETRLSVVKPTIEGPDMSLHYDAGTKEFNPEYICLFKEEEPKQKTYIFKKDLKSCFYKNGLLYINLFENHYAPISNWKSMIKSESFENKDLNHLYGKNIWYKGKKLEILDRDSISKKIEKPLDEYKTFTPNLDEIANSYNGYSLMLDVRVDVNPIVRDSSFSLYEGYRKSKELQNTISNNLEKIDSLIEDKKLKKQLNSISEELNLEEKVNLYNKFVDELAIGVEQLNNKKPYAHLSFDKSMIVPSDLLGKLYIKNKELYFALVSENKIDLAKKWMEENKIKAVLILENA